MFNRLRMFLFVGISSVAANLNLNAAETAYGTFGFKDYEKEMICIFFVLGGLICGYFAIDQLRKLRELS